MFRALSTLVKRSHFLMSIARWFDSHAGLEEIRASERKGVDWIRVMPLIFLHVMCLGVLWVGWSWIALTVAGILYVVRMFAITAFYHRYFSHNAFKATRPWSFVFALLANSAVQRGPLWWASHHRHHHKNADDEADVHSPVQHGFLWSHLGWLTSAQNFPTKMELVPDWARFPELKWIDRFDIVIPVLLAVSLYVLGLFLESYAPQLGTNGSQMLIWGFFISSVVLLHGTATINSLCHIFGTKRYKTGNESRNNLLLSLITLGEGWHNNHHHFAVSARQGFYWWEIDITYYLLILLSWMGIVRDLTPVPERVRQRDVIRQSESP